MSQPSLAELEAERDRLYAQLSQVGDFRRGSVSENWQQCVRRVRSHQRRRHGRPRQQAHRRPSPCLPPRDVARLPSRHPDWLTRNVSDPAWV